jgi:hypothetical protein
LGADKGGRNSDLGKERERKMKEGRPKMERERIS